MNTDSLPLLQHALDSASAFTPERLADGCCAHEARVGLGGRAAAVRARLRRRPVGSTCRRGNLEQKSMHDRMGQMHQQMMGGRGMMMKK
jgi:hypothetical protein